MYRWVIPGIMPKPARTRSRKVARMTFAYLRYPCQAGQGRLHGEAKLMRPVNIDVTRSTQISSLSLAVTRTLARCRTVDSL